MPSENYLNSYKNYALQNSENYSDAKFLPISPWGLRNWVREDAIISISQNLNWQTCIDIGCASGHTTLKLASLNCNKHVTGSDIGESFVKKAEQISAGLGLTNCTFVVAEAEKTEINKFFDLVLLAEVIEHVESIEDLFKGINSITRQGSYLIITCPNLNSDGTLYGRFLRCLGLRKFIVATDFTHQGTLSHGDQHVREFNYKSLERSLARYGWQVKLASGTIIYPLPNYDLFAKVIYNLPGLKHVYRAIELFFTLHFGQLSKLFARHLVYVFERKN
jgi:2-polyprenyl-3-methyl-5-hydroxy-6-metoxy-1,4-benzoquinol methylase